jgi:PAS domain S-box-containing protein
MPVEDYPVSRVISTKKPCHDYIVGIKRADRENITWVIANAAPVFLDENKVEKVILNFLDITDRKKRESELQRLRNDLDNIINSMPSMLVGIDAKGTITYWNRKAEKVTGRTADEVVGKPLDKAMPRLSVEMGRVHRAIRSGQEQSDHKRSRWKNGNLVFEDLTIYPLITNGMDGAVIRIDDVTEKVRLEEMMVQSEKMLSVGGLAAGMAHEINNPLAGILQNTAVLENRLFGDLPASHKAAEKAGIELAALRQYLEIRSLPTMLDNIRASGNRAAAIVKNMLSFARKSDRVVSSHDLGALLDQTLELAQTDYDMKKHYDFKQIQIIHEYDETAPPVPCESSKIQQVFLNILKNGAEAMAENAGESTSPTFLLRVKDDEPWVRVEIEDNGPGMDEITRRRIFEPFFTTKPVGKGTGLGLSVSYFIITENHGGKMDAHVVDGGGTRFIVQLPKTGIL